MFVLLSYDHSNKTSSSFAIAVDTPKNRTIRFDGYRAKREDDMRTVKAKAQKQAAATQKQHAAELQREQSKLYKQERESSKKIVQLEGKSETVCKSIIETLRDKAKLLDQWREFHEEMFGETHDIPASPTDNMHLSKLNGAVFNADTCNGARLTSSLLAEEVEEAVAEKAAKDGEDAPDVMVLQQDCHHHMRNVWIGALTKRLSNYLNEVLACDLDSIDFRLRVSTMMDAVLRAVDKEFSLPANYPKGHGDMFKHWLKKNHPGALLVPVQRTSGSHQDLAVKGAAAVYWNRK